MASSASIPSFFSLIYTPEIKSVHHASGTVNIGTKHFLNSLTSSMGKSRCFYHRLTSIPKQTANTDKSNVEKRSLCQTLG
jgi:hypothetical protein